MCHYAISYAAYEFLFINLTGTIMREEIPFSATVNQVTQFANGENSMNSILRKHGGKMYMGIRKNNLNVHFPSAKHVFILYEQVNEQLVAGHVPPRKVIKFPEVAGCWYLSTIHYSSLNVHDKLESAYQEIDDMTGFMEFNIMEDTDADILQVSQAIRKVLDENPHIAIHIDAAHAEIEAKNRKILSMMYPDVSGAISVAGHYFYL